MLTPRARVLLDALKREPDRTLCTGILLTEAVTALRDAGFIETVAVVGGGIKAGNMMCFWRLTEAGAGAS